MLSSVPQLVPAGRSAPRPRQRATRRPSTDSRAYLRLVEPTREIPEVLRGRDPDLIRSVFPYLAGIVDRYFRLQVEGEEHLDDKACLIASTHNGAWATPDLYGLMVTFWRRFGLETPAYGLMHDVVFKFPFIGELLRRFGAIPAGQRNARTVLRSGFPLLVCPGGDIDSLKPFSRRHRITFGERRGFIRAALREQVPIIPVVSVGAHESIIILNDGRRLARLIGFAKYLRIKSVPLGLGIPFGITPAGLLSVPLPSKIKLRVLPPIELAERPSAAEDDVVVERCFAHVRDTMQRELDDLSKNRRFLIG